MLKYKENPDIANEIEAKIRAELLATKSVKPEEAEGESEDTL